MFKSTFCLKLALNQADRIIFALKYLLFMIKLDFSDVQNNGFRIQQFRITWSKDLRSARFKKLMTEYKSSGDLLNERDLLIKRLTEQLEINFTIYWFSEKLMVLFFIATIIASVSNHITLAVSIILAFLSIILFIISFRNKIAFVMGNLGIEFARSIYNSEIKEKYNF